MAVALLDVCEPVVLVGRGPQRLGQQRPAVDTDRQLAAASAKRRALDADDVAEVEAYQLLVGVAQHVLARMELDAARAVREIEEGGLAVAAPARQAAGEPHRVVGLLPVGEAGVALEHVGDRACGPANS